jgi:hypothetical protein
MGKMWTIQVSGLNVTVRPSSRKAMPTWETITTMRMWAVTKASRHKAVLSSTKTIWAIVRSIREMRQSTRRSVRQSTRVKPRWEIIELITIWVSSIIKASLLDSLVSEAKLIQVTSTTTKHANKSLLSQLGGFFLHISLGVEGWLWIGWVVSFGGFDCYFLCVVLGARNELGTTLLTLILTPLKTNTQFVCGIGYTLLNPTQVILNYFLTHNRSLKARSQISNLLLQLDVLFGSIEKLTLDRATHIAQMG